MDTVRFDGHYLLSSQPDALSEMVVGPPYLRFEYTY